MHALVDKVCPNSKPRRVEVYQSPASPHPHKHTQTHTEHTKESAPIKKTNVIQLALLVCPVTTLLFTVTHISAFTVWIQHSGKLKSLIDCEVAICLSVCAYHTDRSRVISSASAGSFATCSAREKMPVSPPFVAFVRFARWRCTAFSQALKNTGYIHHFVAYVCGDRRRGP